MSLGKLARRIGVFLIPLLVIPLATCTQDAAPTARLHGPEGLVQTSPDTLLSFDGDLQKGVAVGPLSTRVSMDTEGLRAIHIFGVTSGVTDSAAHITHAVLGDYDPAVLNKSSVVPVSPRVPVVEVGGDCIECGEILVCGVNPKCR